MNKNGVTKETLVRGNKSKPQWRDGLPRGSEGGGRGEVDTEKTFEKSFLLVSMARAYPKRPKKLAPLSVFSGETREADLRQ